MLGSQSRVLERHCKTQQRRRLPFLLLVWFFPSRYGCQQHETPNVIHPQVIQWHLNGPASACQLPSRWLPACQPWYPREPHWNPSRCLLVNQIQTLTLEQTPPPPRKLQLHAFHGNLDFCPTSVPSFGIPPRSRAGSCSLPQLFCYSLEIFT